MSISIEGGYQSGKELFARYLRTHKGIDYKLMPYKSDCRNGYDPAVRCIVTHQQTDRTVRYLVKRNKLRPHIFEVSKLVFRFGKYKCRDLTSYYYDKRSGKLIPETLIRKHIVDLLIFAGLLAAASGLFYWLSFLFDG